MITTFKVLVMPNGQARLVIWEDDQVQEIFEADPKKIRTRARKLLDQALGICETR